MRHIALLALLAFSGPAMVSPALAADAVRATLPNGLRVVVVPDRLAPVVSTQLAYLAGSADGPDGFPGTAHALEHMMFRGAANLDRDQLYEVSALMGGAYNASTAETVTQYTYTVAAPDLPVVLRIEAGRMRGATITQADWAQERGAIEQEVSRNLSNPAYRMYAALQQALFAGTPYEFDALGSRPTFDQTDAALLRRFYDRWYAPNNAILVIAGDVDPAAAIAQATEAFKDVPARPVPPHEPVRPGPVRTAPLALPTSQAFGTALLAFRMPGFRAADFAAADILGDVLGSQRGGLFALGASGEALAGGFSFRALPESGMGLAVARFAEGTDPQALLAAMRAVLARAAAGEIDADLVESSKKAEVAQIEYAADSIGGLARLWARTLAVQGADSPADLARAYAAVTPADVRRVAAAVLDPAGFVPLVMTPGAGAPPPGPAAAAAETPGTPPDGPVVLPEWARVALTETLPKAAEAPPARFTLANGLTILVRTETASRSVLLEGRVRITTETAEPPGKEGVAALTERLFDFGTESRGRIAFRTALDDIPAQASAGSAFSLKALSPDFTAAVALLAENQLRPAFPADALDVIRRQLVASRAGQLRSPEFQFTRALERAILPENDPALREPTPASLGGLTRADVLAYHAANFRPDRTTIVVVGDVAPEEARRAIEVQFGAWRNPEAPPSAELPPLGANAAAKVRVPDPGASQDAVVLAQTLPLAVASPERYPLLLGNVALGGGFSSRLTRDLRVRTGYVYSVSSTLDWTRTRGDYQIRFGADPDKVEAATALALANIRTMQTVALTDAELARAKAQILRQFALGGASTAAIAARYLRFAELGQPLDAAERATAAYATLTAEEIRAAFAKWLRPDDLVQGVRGPPPP